MLEAVVERYDKFMGNIKKESKVIKTDEPSVVEYRVYNYNTRTNERNYSHSVYLKTLIEK